MKEATTNTNQPKRVHVKSWGCQMNVYDSQRMVDLLAPLGYAPVDEAAGADLVILNTCHIREKATEKLFSELGRLQETQQERAAQGSEMLIAVAGCVAQQEGEALLKRLGFVDLVLGPDNIGELPALLRRLEHAARRDVGRHNAHVVR